MAQARWCVRDASGDAEAHQRRRTRALRLRGPVTNRSPGFLARRSVPGARLFDRAERWFSRGNDLKPEPELERGRWQIPSRMTTLVRFRKRPARTLGPDGTRYSDPSRRGRRREREAVADHHRAALLLEVEDSETDESARRIFATALFRFVARRGHIEPKYVAIDPPRSFGRPVFAGSRVPTEVIPLLAARPRYAS